MRLSMFGVLIGLMVISGCNQPTASTDTAGGQVTYEVAFDPNGGSVVDGITGVVAGTTISEPSEPTLANYSFQGWFRDSGLSIPWDFAADTVNSNIMLYAKWQIMPVTEVGRTVTGLSLSLSDAEGYAIGEVETVDATVTYQVLWSDGSTTTPTDGAVSWTGGNNDGSVSFSSFGAVTLTAQSTTDPTVSASVTLTANNLSQTVWSMGSYDITFDKYTAGVANWYDNSSRSGNANYTVSGTQVSLSGNLPAGYGVYQWSIGNDDFTDGRIYVSCDNSSYAGSYYLQ